MTRHRHSGSGERGSAAAVVAAILFILLLGLGAYMAWGLLLTPRLTAVSPNPAAEKSAVTLQGSRFSAAAGGNIVLFGDQAGRVLRAAPSELEVQVPELGLPAGGRSRVPVRVLVDGRVSDVVELTIAVLGPPAEPSPTPSPQVTESPEPSPTPSEPSTTPTPKSRTTPAEPPRPKPTAAPSPGAATFLVEAEAAAKAGTFERAAQLYELALEQEPDNAKAKAGLEAARAVLTALARTFVLGKTQVEGPPKREDMKSFDTRDVSVRKPPEVRGRVEIEAVPQRVKAGDAVSFKVWLQNEGTKPIKVASVNLAITLDTVRSSGPLPTLLREVAPGRRALLAEVPSTWKPVATAWRLEVQITSERGETYSNALSWK